MQTPILSESARHLQHHWLGPLSWACADFRGAHGRMDFDHKFHRDTVLRTVRGSPENQTISAGQKSLARSGGPCHGKTRRPLEFQVAHL